MTRRVGEAGHGERHAGRDVGLDHAGDDVHARPLRGDDEVDADGAGLLGDAGDRLLDVAGRHHHQVVELVDDDDDERQALVLPVATGSRASRRRVGAELAPVERGVVAADVAEADLGQQVVATLHLLDRPAERVGRLLGVGDRLGQQVGQPVVLAHLDLLGVDEDEAHLVGRGAHQQRRDDAVDAARLAGAGGAGDQQVGRRGEVEEHGLAGDVLADRHLQRAGGGLGLGRDQQVAEGDELAGVVGDLDADRRAAGDRGEDADVGGRHGVGDVALQAGDPGDLDAGAELELVAGDGGADGHADERRVDAVLAPATPGAPGRAPRPRPG